MKWTRLPSSALRLTGADRVDFVQGQMTNDLRRAPTPGLVPALFLSVRGQIEHFARVYRREDDLYLHLDEHEAAPLAARLRRYVIFDQVEIQDLTDTLVTFHLTGGTPDGWNDAGGDAQTLNLAGATVLAGRVNRTGTPGLDLHVLARQQDAVLAALGGEEVSPDQAERGRVHAGISDPVRDRWQGSLLQEVGLDEAISYRKGCYVGQEIMARLEARGNTRFRLAALEGRDLPSFAEVRLGDRVVGTTGHSVGDRVLVKLRKDVEVGTTVLVGSDADSVTARVEDARPAGVPGVPAE